MDSSLVLMFIGRILVEESDIHIPGLIPSVFGDVTGARIVMPLIIISLQFS